ncbi:MULTISPECIES: DUF4294 domain-containing protein [unclassified Tenacibaculum]|uniref:DUF4294 domain-containing protein n=1 Tax=unclassified Tenacibaculum TaxID=2635139 RepID=UPI001F32B4D3|nr:MULTISPECIES: DUF4294 domain-containing protein [unclassified Tenacibaculum]MCF2873064.1 DUF4294 domain-containing protein [Tenacibaculum sp. Cn5-1]MCF2933220.1 DUF4294 domain-containing protein [Tenacibaculum sp. Cn5-34]MCG7510199.1 DUF4294 domain-containing protein [Tenacibaculum sp. Cn5-46]
MKKLIYICIILIAGVMKGQIKDTLPNFNDEYFLIKDGDSLMITLNEVSVLPKHKFKKQSDVHYYYWFRRKVFKAYPYAVLAAKRIDSVNSRLSRIKSKSKKRRYVKRVQKYLEEELTKPLKKLTRTEGRLLLKLIHRQTGKTAFNNVKELRSGWKAFWYNTTANLFKLSLKSEYKPESENEDYLIEDIIQRALIDEKIEYQKPKLEKDYKSIVINRKGKVDVEEYIKMFAKMKKKKKKSKKTKRIKKN